MILVPEDHIPPPPDFFDRLKAKAMWPVTTILIAILFNWINEMRSDIKLLLERTNIDKTDITTMKVDIDMMKAHMYGSTAGNIPMPPPKQNDPANREYVLPDNSKKNFIGNL